MAQERELRAKLKELRDHIVKNADNVGESFPNEARKMHYGEIEHRPIYGEASPDEAQCADRGRRRGIAAAGAAGRQELAGLALDLVGWAKAKRAYHTARHEWWATTTAAYAAPWAVSGRGDPSRVRVMQTSPSAA